MSLSVTAADVRYWVSPETDEGRREWRAAFESCALARGWTIGAGGDAECDPPRPTVNPYAEERARAWSFIDQRDDTIVALVGSWGGR